MGKIFFIGMMLLSSLSHATVRIAVFDTGLNGHEDKVCSTGSYDYIENKKGVGLDFHGHGTNIVSAISAQIQEKDYCFLIYKVIEPNIAEKTLAHPFSRDPMDRIAFAIQYAINEGADYMNLSMYGSSKSDLELDSLNVATDLGVEVFVAAGNNHFDLDKKCDTFYACYDVPKMHIVGALEDGKQWIVSNFGRRITDWEDKKFENMQGTSQATAISLGKHVDQFLKGQKYDFDVRRIYVRSHA